MAEDGAELDAEGEFVDAGSVDATADREEGAAGVLRRAGASPPRRAEPGDEGDVGQRLDVVHEGRSPVDPSLGRAGEASPSAWRRRRSRSGSAPTPHRRRSGTGVATISIPSVSTRSATAVRTASRAARFSRSTQTIARSAPTAMAAAIDAVEHQMRSETEQDGVLSAGGLSLGAVGDHDGGAATTEQPPLPGARSHRRHLDGGGEAGTASTPQAGGSDLVDQAGRRPGRHRTEAAQVGGQRGRRRRRDEPGYGERARRRGDRRSRAQRLAPDARAADERRRCAGVLGPAGLQRSGQRPRDDDHAGHDRNDPGERPSCRGSPASRWPGGTTPPAAPPPRRRCTRPGPNRPGCRSPCRGRGRWPAARRSTTSGGCRARRSSRCAGAGGCSPRWR